MSILQNVIRYLTRIVDIESGIFFNSDRKGGKEIQNRAQPARPTTFEPADLDHAADS